MWQSVFFHAFLMQCGKTYAILLQRSFEQMIAIVDYGAGNLQSVKHALDFLGAKAQICADAAEILRADAVILPGVGAFGDAMRSMEQRGLCGAVREAAQDAMAGGKPFLGICLGMQLLFPASQESPGVPGLALLEGAIERLPANGLKVPHIGWNSLTLSQRGGMFAGIAKESYCYFVHSFYLHALDRSFVAAQSCYGVTIDAAIARGNLTACQFHPEKSGDLGLLMLQNFINLR